MNSKRRPTKTDLTHLLNPGAHSALPLDHPRRRISLPLVKFLERPDPDDDARMRTMTLGELMRRLHHQWNQRK